MMYFSWLLDVCFELFPLNALSLYDLLDATFPFCLVLREALAVVFAQLFLNRLLLAIFCIGLCSDGPILIDFC